MTNNIKEVQKYHPFAVFIHWVMAILIGYCMVSAVIKGYLPKGALKTDVMNFHKWFGVTILSLVIARVSFRIFNKPPKLDSGNKKQDLAAHAAHYLLYLLMILVPLVGVLMMQFGGYPLTFFGLPIEQLTDVNKAFSKELKEIHEFLGFAFIGLVVVHILAAIKHHYFDKDGLLNKMKF